MKSLRSTRCCRLLHRDANAFLMDNSRYLNFY